MGELLETHGASSPNEYFGKFFSHKAYYSSGISVTAPGGLEFRDEAIQWSLRSQEIKTKVTDVVAELHALKEVHVLIFRTSWREDLRIVAFLPSAEKGVLIQAGY